MFYSDTELDGGIPDDIVIRNKEDYGKALSKGGKYLLLPEFYSEENTVKSSFIPVFWSPVHFPTEDPLGFIVDEESKVLQGFPTEKYADYQWKSLVENSRSVRLKDVPGDPNVLFEFVPNFADNEPKSPLFTFTEGNAEFIYCGFDLSVSDPASKALLKSISRYLAKWSYKRNSKEFRLFLSCLKDIIYLCPKAQISLHNIIWRKYEIRF